jgi:drug/metabolite transporter (DMT)-like permease
MGALLALNWVLFMGALQLVDVAVAVLLAYCGPVFVAALTPLVMRERFDRRVIVPLLLALGGTAVIVSPSDISFTSGTAALGATMAFGSAVTYALLILNAKRLLRGIPATVYMLGEYMSAGILLLPAVLLLDGPSMPMEWAALLALGVLNTALTGLLFLSGLRTVRADHAAILTYAEPVSAVAFAAAFLGESLTAATIAGGAAVLTGGLMVTRLRPSAAVEGPPVLMEADAEPREREHS